MKGLFQKDIYNLIQQGKSLLYIFVIFVVVFVSQGKADFFVPMWITMCIMLVTTSMSLDGIAKWDTYALTMPVTRTELVVSKYILGICLTLFGVLSSFCVLIGSNFILKNIEWKEALILLGVASGIGLFYLSIILPLLFKFGVEKARIFMMMGYLVPFIFIYGIAFLAKNSQIPIPEETVIEEFLTKGIVMFPVIGLLCLGVSIWISIRIFQKIDK